MPFEKHILFTGGGSAGHVTPNIAIIEKLLSESLAADAATDWRISYIGSRCGIERELLAPFAARGVAYYAIATGKLRRYFSWRTFIDPFKIVYGIAQAWWLCRKLKPDVIFSKGGFVSFPVVVAGWLWRIPVILHESDLTPGLANKLCYPFATKVCLTFAASTRYFAAQNDKGKIIVTGTPIRASLLHGDAARGLALAGFAANKKTLLIIGGSLGAGRINQVLRQALPRLINDLDLQIIHICGAGKIVSNINYPEYKQFEYVHAELADLFAAANLVISRAGANSVYELLSLKKPHIFIPLSKQASRGDQIDNALYFAKQGVSQVILEEKLTVDTLVEEVTLALQHEADLVAKLQALDLPRSLALISAVIAGAAAI